MMKYTIQALIASMILVFGLTASAQEVRRVSKAEYIKLKENPEKMDELKSKGIRIEVVEESEIQEKPGPVIITKSEFAKLKADPTKYEAFIKSSNGFFDVIDDPVVPKVVAPEPAQEKPAAPK